MSKITDYFQGAQKELSQVKWPTKKQLVEITTIVLIFTFALAVFLGVVDWVFTLPFKFLT